MLRFDGMNADDFVEDQQQLPFLTFQRLGFSGNTGRSISRPGLSILLG
jgi:hypothetical protein